MHYDCLGGSALSVFKSWLRPCPHVRTPCCHIILFLYLYLHAYARHTADAFNPSYSTIYNHRCLDCTAAGNSVRIRWAVYISPSCNQHYYPMWQRRCSLGSYYTDIPLHYYYYYYYYCCCCCCCCTRDIPHACMRDLGAATLVLPSTTIILVH
jgi:hypothetical protein